MICLGDVEKLALHDETIGRLSHHQPGNILHSTWSVRERRLLGFPPSPFLLSWSFSFSFLSLSIYIISVPLDYSHCVRDWSCYTSCICLRVRDFGLFPINVWSILYRYCLCMKATKLRLNSIQWHNICS